MSRRAPNRDALQLLLAIGLSASLVAGVASADEDERPSTPSRSGDASEGSPAGGHDYSRFSDGPRRVPRR
ncbi:MAG: hypothetical protein OEY14_10585, partial [Myxococcales bacterium]|nr:hypothetical protein [Myxococcales bacterium]